jgi:hypothetical protein
VSVNARKRSLKEARIFKEMQRPKKAGNTVFGVWVMNMNSEDAGWLMYSPQSIEKALDDIEKDPSVALALPRIPGKPNSKVSFSDDISVIDSQYGMIIIQAAVPSEGEIKALLLLQEKIRVFRQASRRFPNLYAETFGIKDVEAFENFAEVVRTSRNEAAHPYPLVAIKGNPENLGIPGDYIGYATSLLEWDPTLYSLKHEGSPSKNIKKK